MIDWKYDPKNYEGEMNELIPAGDYRVRIEEAKEQVSHSGKEMIRLKLKVNGNKTPLWYYVVFDGSSEESRKRTDQRLGSVYESFKIERGNLEVRDWVGKYGGVRIRNRPDSNGDLRSEVHYVLSSKRTSELPMWQEDSQTKEATGWDKPAETYSTEEILRGVEIPF